MADYHKTESYRRKLSEARKRRKALLGYINSPETREKMRLAKLGKPNLSAVGRKRNHGSETRRKISISKIGDKNHNWKGGVASLNREIRKLGQYRHWRVSVYQKDNYTCQGCGKRGGQLEPHHKKSLASIIKEYSLQSTIDAINCRELWDVSNGQTLCHECHSETDSFRKQWIII